MIYGYIRVSTDKQETNNQRFEIENFARANHITIDLWVEETISSRQDLKHRKLYPLLKKMKKDDLMIACELSRLGRNLMQIMSILHGMLEKECQIWTIKDNYRLGNDISSKVLAFAFGLSAEIERNLISQRTKAALARKKSEGLVLGRPLGSSNGKRKLDDKELQIKELLKNKISFSAIARILKCHRLTVSSICKQNGWSQPVTGVYRGVPGNKLLDTEITMSKSQIIEMYKQHFSVTGMAKSLGVSPTALNSYIKRHGFMDEIIAINDDQRNKCKSNRQLQREGFVTQLT